MSDSPRPLELVTSGIPDPPLRRDRLDAAEAVARYGWAAGAVRGAEVLDAGCGDGRGALMLAQAGASSVTAVDVGPRPTELERADGTGELAPVEPATGDVQALPFADGRFDVVVCLDVIQDLADPERGLDELRRVLRPNGLAFVSSPAPGEGEEGEPAPLARPLGEAALREALGRRFANVRIERQRTALVSYVGGSGDEDRPALGLHATAPAGADPPGSAAGHLVAIASDGALPELPCAAALGADRGIPELAEAAAAWEERARREAAEAGADRFELNHARKSLEIARRRLDELGSRGLLARLRRRP